MNDNIQGLNVMSSHWLHGVGALGSWPGHSVDRVRRATGELAAGQAACRVDFLSTTTPSSSAAVPWIEHRHQPLRAIGETTERVDRLPRRG
jgi:hypothetical protein